jgi:DNA-directed RNA polymerase specialized sigma24 family protein
VEWESEFAAFCIKEHPRLVGALSLYCGDRVLAEELAQDALSGPVATGERFAD